MHSSYSHFSWFCYPDSFKLHPTIQYTHQLRLPAKNILTITLPLLNFSGNLPTQCSKRPIFKLTGFNLRKENCKFIWSAPWLQGSASQSNTGANSDTGGKDKIFMCLPSEIPQGWFTFTQKWLPWQLPNVHKNDPAEVCIFSCF